MALQVTVWFFTPKKGAHSVDILKVLFAEESAVTSDPDPFLPAFPAYKHGGPEFLLQIGEQKGMTIYLKRYRPWNLT